MASALVEKGMPVKVYDLSKTGTDVVLGEVFRASHLVLASATHDGGIFEPMDYLLHAMLAHNVQGRKVLLMENGSWAPMAGKQMKTLVEAMKEMTIMEQIITIKSALTPEQEKTFAELAEDFVK
jgi:flavorubredoxin